MSELHVLNVGEGDTRLSFDKNKPNERKRAARIVRDMLKLGYAISVEVDLGGGRVEYRRAEGFDPDTCEYLITDKTRGTQATRRRTVSRHAELSHHVPADRTTAVAIARPAGGCAREAW